MLVGPDGRIPWPVNKKFMGVLRKIFSGFVRNDGITKHGALDIIFGSLEGAPVYATHNGKVTSSGTNKTKGRHVTITNGDVRTTYMHLKKEPLVKIGEDVNEAQQIGIMGGKTEPAGTSTGAHLHYQIQVLENGIWTNFNPVKDGTEVVNKDMAEKELIDPQKDLIDKLYSAGTMKEVNIMGSGSKVEKIEPISPFRNGMPTRDNIPNPNSDSIN